MFKSQGQGVNPGLWAVTLPCSEATTVGRQSLDAVTLPWAAFLHQECDNSTWLRHFAAFSLPRDVSWGSWELPMLLVALGIWDLGQLSSCQRLCGAVGAAARRDQLKSGYVLH